ncbi:MAG TPA: hypothetical protein VHN98_04170 [Acidimicrobiales bacterium]|nr:hypothetical protein [Acidimicrobiales bacterium]
MAEDHEEPSVEDEEIDMATFSHALIKGTILGVPLTFAVAMFVMWIGPRDWAVWGAALWSAIVAGTFFGGVFALNIAIGRVQTQHATDRAARRAAIATVRTPGAATPHAA